SYRLHQRHGVDGVVAFDHCHRQWHGNRFRRFRLTRDRSLRKTRWDRNQRRQQDADGTHHVPVNHEPVSQIRYSFSRMEGGLRARKSSAKPGGYARYCRESLNLLYNASSEKFMGQTYYLYGARTAAVLLAVSLALAPPLPSQQRGSAGDADSNFMRCLDGLSSCQVRLLGPQDLTRIAEARQKKNVDLCLSGAPACDPTILPKAELSRVAAANARRNLERCSAGTANCDPT